MCAYQQQTRPVIIKNEFTKNKAYERKEIIGKGAYGEVYKAIDQTTRELVALKAVNLKESEGFPISSLREIVMLKNLSHPNIVKLHDIVIEGKDWATNSNAKVMLALEYYPHDFSGIINDRDVKLKQAMIKAYIHQLLSAVAYIHSQGVMHRDMKTSNILLSFDGDVKLTDFGLSCFVSLDPHEDYQSLVVTRWYRSPELLLGETNYDCSVDMWSVGCILAEFMLGSPLFRGNDSKDQLRLIFESCGTPDRNDWPQAEKLRSWEEMKQYNKENRLNEQFKRFANNPVLDLLQRLLCLNPKKRITAAEALNHEWFTQEPLPNKDAGRLPGLARNELWIKKRTVEEQQNKDRPNQQHQQQHHNGSLKRPRDTSTHNAKSRQSFVPPINPTIANENSKSYSSVEPPRKQRKFTATNSNQNHYRTNNYTNPTNSRNAS